MCNDLPDDMLELIAEYSNASASDMLECKNWLLPQTFGKVPKREFPHRLWDNHSYLQETEFVRSQPIPTDGQITEFKRHEGHTHIDNVEFILQFGDSIFHCPEADADLARHTLLQFLMSENGDDRVRIWSNQTDTAQSKSYTHFWFLPLQEESPKNVLHVTLTQTELKTYNQDFYEYEYDCDAGTGGY